MQNSKSFSARAVDGNLKLAKTSEFIIGNLDVYQWGLSRAVHWCDIKDEAMENTAGTVMALWSVSHCWIACIKREISVILMRNSMKPAVIKIHMQAAECKGTGAVRVKPRLSLKTFCTKQSFLPVWEPHVCFCPLHKGVEPQLTECG